MKNVATVPYTVDFAARKIIVTSQFMEKAGIYNSDEYKTFMGIRKDLPDFTFEMAVEKKPSKNKGILSLDTMEAYIIRIHGEESNAVQEFRRVRENSKVEKAGRYSYMKKWFHEVYPEGYRMLCKIGAADERAKERKEKALLAVDNALTMNHAVSLSKDAAEHVMSIDTTSEASNAIN